MDEPLTLTAAGDFAPTSRLHRQLEATLARATYRPGWRLQLAADMFQPRIMALLVYARVFDATPARLAALEALGRQQLERPPAGPVAVRLPGHAPTDDYQQVVLEAGEIAHRHLVPVHLVDRWADDLAGRSRYGSPAVALEGVAGEFLRWTFDRLGDVELHERAEWFKVDQVAVANPHGHAGYRGLRWPANLEDHLRESAHLVNPAR